MKTRIIFLLTFLFAYYTSAQQKLVPLKIGDQIPDFKFSNVLNTEGEPIRISDYKGKILILDFWATWCAPCIASFPRLDSLDKAFGDQLAIIPATYEKVKPVENLFNRMESIKHIRKPMIVEDNILRSIFPHKILPHYVWIDQEGKVLAFTESSEVTTKNIQKILEDNNTSLNQKDMTYKTTILEKSYFNSEIIKPETLLFQSSIAGYTEGLLGAYKVHFDENKKVERIIVNNQGIIQLYKLAYGELNSTFSQNRLRIEVEHLDSIQFDGSGQKFIDWKKQGNAFCYELFLGEYFRDRAFEIMRDDLNRFFPQYKAQVIMEDIDIWALVITDEEKAAQLKTKRSESILKDSFSEFSMTNRKVSWLISILNIKYLQDLNATLVDKTGLKDNIDLLLQGNMTDIQSIRKALEPYGLDFIPQKEKVPVLLISDNLNRIPTSL
ncbi:thiol-disulfide isomerase-like thioredoxin [Belliella baltica DSM 15883]|uniref:Thiol-disulfide isomerase-like thioredoxin n=1 Tax=Belliella baltica (strain DSM 15883 / CIP 108006 / LMG 21964 / BA134) TaxID=866536 RepID=I3Z2Y7_BELBD|nr:TlpA disulfide reductase family protein [Belliella baltica]AFL83605.1 thiol-disulfide isomerase-like thioredoxin [Belliella baltica DSM 15883]